MSTTIVSKRIHVRGTVQGVGFRPFVYRLAQRHGLRGWVSNGSTGVQLLVEGESEGIECFLRDLRAEAPLLARIETLDVEATTTTQSSRFEIRPSITSPQHAQPVPADVATCDECLRELFDPWDGRYRYAFINCTNCGPRFTIVDSVPYDRERTTMAGFRMCGDCRREYDDPLDRRFHAQPNACPNCGPQVRLLDARGARLDELDPISAAVRKLLEGDIVAVKGVGGYHLAVDARNEMAVARLRRRKHREEKPFAMIADLSTAKTICFVDEFERDLLESRRRPIVLLKKREASDVAGSVAPEQRYPGVMLPYTPLHHLLLADLRAMGVAMPLLVLTSGNISDEPISYQDDEALDRLKTIVDFFLIHERPIRTRCDDSVVRSVEGRELLIRRSRGYTPEPIEVALEFPEPVLACGAHLKNAFCLGKEQYALLSHHIGDLDNYPAFRSFTKGIEHYKHLFDVEPSVVAYDLHPEYLATKYAHELHAVRSIGIQHHHAHIASVLAEHGLTGSVIGVAFDGTGYGTDGYIWGGEFLIADLVDFTRAAHLKCIHLPGGEQAIREPWRVAAVQLQQAFGEQWLDLNLPFVQDLDRRKWKTLQQMINRDVNSPLASSMGRLFDAVASMAIGCKSVAYEGQAAIELEMLADASVEDAYEFSLVAGLTVDPSPMIRSIVDELQRGETVETVSARFHNSVVNMIVQVCQSLRTKYKLDRVALSGGVFQNTLLLTKTMTQLRAERFDVYTNHKVPPNDGGIALGQAVIAAARLGAKKCV